MSAARAERIGLAAVLGLGAIATVAALFGAFRQPLTIQDDARQFIFWMAEWRDPALFAGDLVAEYWKSVSPWLFVAVYRVFDLAGVEPLAAARILPALLFPATAFFAWRFARAISGSPAAAAVGAGAMMLWLAGEDGIVSATPRAFAPLFFLMFLDGLARRRAVEIFLGLLCLGLYPHLAVLGGSLLPLLLIDFESRRLVLARSSLALFGLGVAGAAAGLAPFLIGGGRFGPTVTPATATGFPTFGPGGRTPILGPDGTVNFACGPKLGLLDSLPGCHGFASPVFWLVLALIAAAPALLLVRHIRSKGRDGSPIPFAVVLAGLVWFAIGAVLAFKLHQPNRFIIRSIPPMALLSIGLLIGEDFLRRMRRNPSLRRWAAPAAIGCGLAVFTAVAATQTLRYFRAWKNPALAEAVMRLPPGSVVAGFVADTDFVPALAKRRVLFSRELSVAYQLGYYREIDARMRRMVEAELTPDAKAMAERLAADKVDFYLIETDRLADPRKRPNFAPLLGDFAAERLAALGPAPTALSLLAPRCRQGTFNGVELLDARCLVEAAGG